MKTRVLDLNRFISKKLTKEVDSPVIMVRNEINEKSLLSSEIFGRTPDEKKVMTGFIKLHKKFIHPLLYKGYFKRRYADVDNIILGKQRYVIDDKYAKKMNLDGNLVPVEEGGGTGLEWFYENFDDMKLRNSDSKDSDGVLTQSIKNSFGKLDRSTIFMDKLIVIPLIYRDINRSSGSMALDELNGLYQKLINLNSMYSESNNPLFDERRIDYNIQQTLVAIFEHFQSKVFGKDGIQRRKVMGKTVDYSARAVISAPSFNGYFGESPIDMDRGGFHLGITVGTFLPLMIYKIKNLLKSFYDNGCMGELSISEFDENFDNQRIKEFIEVYIHSYGDRFKPIDVNGEGCYIKIKLKRGSEEIERNLTLIELLYIAAYDELEAKERYMVISRYPINDIYNILPIKIHVLSTVYVTPVEIGGVMYKHYPDIFLYEKKMSSIDIDITTVFHETVKISNTLLAGLDGDYDGDKIGIRSVMSNEATAECRKLLNAKLNVIDMNGGIIKFVKAECVQALYSLSINPTAKSKYIDTKLVQLILDTDEKDLSPTFIFETLEMGETLKRKIYNRHNDIVVLKKGDYQGITGPTETTLGRLLINKIIFSHAKLDYINVEFTSKMVSKYFDMIRDMVLKDERSLDVLKKCITIYEDFGFRMSSFVNPSLSAEVMLTSEAFNKKKVQLFEDNKEALARNDLGVTDKIEKELIDFEKEEKGNDSFFEWYRSGSSGKMGYNGDFKVSHIMVGGVPRGIGTGEFHVSTSNYIDGTKKEELAIFADQMVIAAYMRAKNTAVSGYMSKQITAVFQSVQLDVHGSDCKTKRYIDIDLTEDMKDKYVGSWLPNGTQLTHDNIDKYIGKRIGIRSPIMCESPKICSKCIGSRVYDILNIYDEPINIGLFVNKIYSEMVQKSLQKTHVMGVNLMEIGDLNDWIIEK